MSYTRKVFAKIKERRDKYFSISLGYKEVDLLINAESSHFQEGLFYSFWAKYPDKKSSRIQLIPLSEEAFLAERVLSANQNKDLLAKYLKLIAAHIDVDIFPWKYVQDYDALGGILPDKIQQNLRKLKQQLYPKSEDSFEVDRWYQFCEKYALQGISYHKGLAILLELDREDLVIELESLAMQSHAQISQLQLRLNEKNIVSFTTGQTKTHLVKKSTFKLNTLDKKLLDETELNLAEVGDYIQYGFKFFEILALNPIPDVRELSEEELILNNLIKNPKSTYAQS